jgi:hypothetical protein
VRLVPGPATAQKETSANIETRNRYNLQREQLSMNYNDQKEQAILPVYLSGF